MNLIFVGKSCSGKTEIVKYLTENFRYNRNISCTTRAPRDGEEDLVDYKFLSRSEFLKKNENDGLACVGEYDGEFYGIDVESEDELENKVFILEPSGAIELYGILKDCLMFYVNTDEGIIFSRQLRRGDSEEMIASRKLYDSIAFDGFSEMCDVISLDNNGDIASTVTSVLEYINLFGG